ncbi:MAG: LamG domain-containing protein [Bacillota bacterium]
MKKPILLMFGIMFVLFSLVSVSAITWDNTAYYKLDETSGDVVDATGNYNGTNNGATREVTGKINNAFDFESSEADAVNLSSSELPNLSSADGLSFQWWIKPESFGGSGGYNFLFDSGGTTRFNLMVSHHEPGANLTGTFGETTVNFGNDLDSGVWTHLVLVIDGTTAKLYKNGVQYGGDKILSTNAIITAEDDKYLGSRYSGGNTLHSFDGIMDEVGIWNRSLTNSEVLELYNDGDALGYVLSSELININLEIPEDETTLSDIGTNFTVLGNNISSQGYNWTNVTYRVWKDNERFNFTTVDFADLETFNETLFIDSFTLGDYEWNALACYGNSTFSNCTTADNNYTYFVGTSETFTNYENNTYETQYELFETNVSILASANLYDVQLYYNGTHYDANYDNLGSGNYRLYKGIDIPLIESSSENMTFKFKLTYEKSDGSFVFQNLTEYTQEVLKIEMGECAGSLTTKTLNFNMYDEENLTQIKNWDFYGTFEYWLGSGTVRQNFSMSDVGINETYVCINPDNLPYYSDAQIQYEKDNYVKRSYYLLNNSLDNETEDIELISLLNFAATSFVVKILDAVQLPIDSAYVSIQRYYPGTGTYKTVSMGLTDDSGKFPSSFEEETEDYKIIVNKNNEILYASDGRKVYCETTPCSITYQISGGDVYNWNDFGNLSNFQWSLEYNNDTKIWTYTYIDTSGSTHHGRLWVYYTNEGETITICNKTDTSSAATLTCNVTGYNGEIYAQAFVSRSPEVTITIKTSLNKLMKDIMGKEGLFLAMFVLLMVGLAGLWNPAVGIILEIAGIVIINMMGLASFGAVTVWGIIIIGCLILWGLKT